MGAHEGKGQGVVRVLHKYSWYRARTHPRITSSSPRPRDIISIWAPQGCPSRVTASAFIGTIFAVSASRKRPSESRTPYMICRPMPSLAGRSTDHDGLRIKPRPGDLEFRDLNVPCTVLVSFPPHKSRNTQNLPHLHGVQCGASSRHRQSAHRTSPTTCATSHPKTEERSTNILAYAPCQLNKIRRSACGWRGLGPRPTCFCFWPGASHTRRRRFLDSAGRAPHLMIALKLKETTPPPHTHVPPPCEHQAETRRKEPRIVKSEESE